MSNKLKFQENPIYVSSFEEFQSYCEIYQSRQSFKANCPVCGKEILFTKNWPKCRRKNLLCKYHLRQSNAIKKYGSWEEMYRQKTVKTKQTFLKRYGVDNIFKRTDLISKAVEKKYGEGITSGGMIKEAHKKQQQTMLDRYGTNCVLTRPEIHEKAIENSRTPEAIQKRKNTCLERYGCEASSQNEEIKDQVRQRCLEKWGHCYGGNRQKVFYLYEDTYFDSSWELAFYIYCKDHGINFEYHSTLLDYYVNGKKHKYEVDFKVGEDLIEIKGGHLLDENGNLKAYKETDDIECINAKNECMKVNKVKIISTKEIKKYLDYIKITYGNNFLQNFRIKK